MDIGMNGMEEQESPQRRQLSFVCYCPILSGGCASSVAGSGALYGTVPRMGADPGRTAQPAQRSNGGGDHSGRQHTAFGRSDLVTVHGVVHHSQ